MARENIFKFEELLRADETLRTKLQELADAFEGDKADEGALFAATVGKLAEEAGLPFSYEEGRELASSRDLSDSELEAVVGGITCYVIGGSDGSEAECETTGAACSYVGVTIA